MKKFQNNSESFQEKSEKLRKVDGDQVILHGSGVSWSCIPRVLRSLKRFEGITTTDVVIAIELFDYCAQSRYFPVFQISYETIAKNTFLSRRQVILSIQRLIVLKLISCVSELHQKNIYQWNEYFLATGEIQGAEFSPALVKDFHQTSENVSLGLVKDLHPVYIDFILNSSLNIFKEFYAEYQKPYSLYTPSKRKQKGVPQGSGTVEQVARSKAWLNAIDSVTRKLLSKRYTDAYVRVYLAMVSGKFMACKTHPTPYLLKLAMDASLQWEAMKKSEIQFYLDTDEAFKNYIEMKVSKGGSDE